MSNYRCDICNYSCGNRKSSLEKHVLSQKHLNRVIELSFKENKTNLSFSNERITGATLSCTVNNTHPPELLTFFAETIQRMETNIQLLSVQNKLITDQNTKLLQKSKRSIKENRKETVEQRMKPTTEYKMKETKEGIEKHTTECIKEDTQNTTKILTSQKKMIDYFTTTHRDAVNISTFYNQERGVSFTDSQMNIERILTTDIVTLVYEWFCKKIETIDKDKLPLQVHKKFTYIKIDEEWVIDNGEKEESFLETFLLPFYELLIETNEETNRTEQEKTMIERTIPKYMCMCKEMKIKILKKIMKHPKIVCNIKV
jgi:hypothetical protein